MPGIFDPAIFDPAIFDTGSAQPTTACTVAQDQAAQEQQAAAQMKLVATVAEDQAVQQQQASAAMRQAVSTAQDQAVQEEAAAAAMRQAVAVAQDQAVQEQHAEVTTSGGQPSTDCSVAQDQAVQEQDAAVILGAATIPGIIPSAGTYTYSQQQHPFRQPRARAKQGKKPLGLTIPHTWENPTQRSQIVTKCTVHQEQPPADEHAELELGPVWRPFEFSPPPMRSTIGPYMGTPRRSPQPRPGAPQSPPPSRRQQPGAPQSPPPARRQQPFTSKASRALSDEEEEKIAVAILSLFR